MSGMTLILIGLAAAALVTSMVFQAATLWQLARRPAVPATALPPVSVLKPIKGAEAGLYENLVALVQQDYLDFEVLVGVTDPTDPAIPVVRRVQLDHPRGRLRLITGAPVLGLNPKVSNLSHLLRFARHEVILVSDADVRPRPDYLRAAVAELTTPGVGLVHNLLVGVGADTLGGRLESLHLNSWVVTAVAATFALAGRPCVIGKSMLFRRTDLERVGGLAGVRNVLAEDFVLGDRFHRAGFGVALSTHAVPVHTAGRPLAAFLNRHLRWSQMRRHISLPAYLGEVLLNPVPLLLAAVLAAVTLDGERTASPLFGLVGVALLLKLLCDSMIARRISGRGLSSTDLFLLPIKDAIVLLLWLVALWRREVRWRGRAMRVETGSSLRPMPGSPAPLTRGNA